jgi:hypothetical protein
MRHMPISFSLPLGVAALSLLIGFAPARPESASPAAWSGVEQPPADSIERALSSRGLLNSFSAVVGRVEPPPGTEVDETRQTAKRDGELISSTRSWTEELDSNSLHVEVTRYPSQQLQVAFWVLPRNGHGCAIFGRTMHGTRGKLLKSEFWRNDRELKITGAADFPADLYPEAVPAIALLRVVDSVREGGSGKINQQVSPYGFVDLQIDVQNTESIEVPAGRFAALKVSSQPVVSTILPSWPRFTQGVVSRFIPQSTYYFGAASPHRMLRIEHAGTPFIGGPEAMTELVRYYIAGVNEGRSPGRTDLKPL